MGRTGRAGTGDGDRREGVGGVRRKREREERGTVCVH